MVLNAGAFSHQLWIESRDKLKRCLRGPESLTARLRPAGGVENVNPKRVTAPAPPTSDHKNQAERQTKSHFRFPARLLTLDTIAANPPPMIAPKAKGPQIGIALAGGHTRRTSGSIAAPSKAPPSI